MSLLVGLYLGPGFTVSGWLLFVNGPGWPEEVTYVPVKTCALDAERLRGRSGRIYHNPNLRKLATDPDLRPTLQLAAFPRGEIVLTDSGTKAW